MTMRKHKITRNFERVPVKVTKQLLVLQEGQGKLLGIGTDIGVLLELMKKAEQRWIKKHGLYEAVPAEGRTRYTRRRKFVEATDLDILRLTRAQVRRERQCATRLKNAA